jgi:trans-aconitate methyltransferase
MDWDALTYDLRFGFVSGYGLGLVDLLDPRPGERVLDLGCGTGALSAEIAARGAAVEGVDADAQMVSRARAEHPGLRFRLGDARTLTLDEPADAVFSNATMHWVAAADQPSVLAAVRRALRPGGRFVAEMGGAGNVTALVGAAAGARAALGLPPAEPPWCFPTPTEQAARLEEAGFGVCLIEHFDRPTPLTGSDTAADWTRMFGRYVLAGVPTDRQAALLAELDRLAAPALRDSAGRWTADYVRLRWWAVAGPP